jgi:hypothetical protein
MYPCRGLEVALLLYHFNLMGGRRAWNLEEHLSHCYRCKLYLGKLGWLSRLARTAQGHSDLDESKSGSFAPKTSHRQGTGFIKMIMAIFLFLLLVGFMAESIQATEKIVIGEAENAVLLPWGVVLPSRIDTGAGISALDVRDLKLLGKSVEFRLPERYGDLLIRLPLAGWRGIKAADGPRKRRPAVEVDLCLSGVRIRTLVTLCDRSHMEYPLLIGRKALRGNPEADFIVDVSRSFTVSLNCAKENLP